MVETTTLPYLVPVILSALVTASLAGFAWRRREEPGATAFAVLMGTVTVWSGGYAVALTTHERSLRLLWLYVEWTAIPFVAVAWLAFALVYAGYGRVLSRRVVIALAVLPGVTVVLAWTNELHGLVWTTNEVVVASGVVLLAQTFGPWFYANLVYGYVLTAVGMALLLKPVVSDDPLHADQAVALVVGVAVPLLSNFLSVLGLAPLPGLDLTPIALTVTGVAFGAALFRYRLLGVLPALRRLGRDVALSDLGDGVLVLDRDHLVRDLNPAAERLFDVRRSDVLGAPVDAVVGTNPVEAAGDRVQFPSPDGRRALEASVSPVSDQHDRVIAHALIVRDVTERETREQRLAVLNRVLRHNVRNDLSVVAGYVGYLDRRLPEEEREVVDRIESGIADLVAVARKARQAEELMAGADAEREAVDPARLVERVCDRVGSAYPACDLDVAVESTAVETDPAVLEPVLANVVENAAEHNDAAEPRVEVSATVEGTDRGDRLVVRVADNGPGIPAQELVAVETEREEDLRHASGLGLWLAAWGVDRLGGTIEVANDEPRGAVVTVRVPA